MPTMLRIPGRGKKIAYKVLGIPDNLRSKRTPTERRVNRELIFQETTRVR